MDHDDKYWAQRAAALLAEGARDNVPRMEPPPPPPQGPLRISGASVQAVFYGVGSNDAFLNISGVGAKRGPTGKAEYIVTRKHALPANPYGGVTTLGELAGSILGAQLGMELRDLCVQVIKVQALQAGVREVAMRFEMLSLDTRIQIEQKPDTAPDTKLILYLRAGELLKARARSTAIKYGTFLEDAATEVGGVIKGATAAGLIGHSASSIKKALNPAQSQNGEVLKAIETFMNEHYTSGFSKLEVEIAKLALKSGKRAPDADPLLDGGGAAAKRPRVNLSGLMGAHIDTYLSEYTIYSGNKERRGKLYASILAAAENQSTLKEEVAKWGDRSEKIISDRLHNTLREHNKKEKAAAAAAEAAEAATAAAGGAEGAGGHAPNA